MPARYLAFFRAILLEVLLLQTLYGPEATRHSAWLWLLFPAYGAWIIFLYWAATRREQAASVHLSPFLIDIAVTSLVLYFVGDPSSHFYVAYFLVILVSCFLQKLSYSFIIGIVACVVYASLTYPGWGKPEDSFYLLRLALLMTTAFFSAVVADWTRRIEQETSQKYEERLAWMQRLTMVGRAVSSILHELRSPMSTILISADYIKEIADEPGQKNVMLNQLEVVKREALRAADILSDFLDFAKPKDLTLESLPVQRPLRKALESAGVRFKEKNIILEDKLGGDMPVMGSERHLTQVFTNLIMNAVYAMPMGGTLRVEVKLSADQLKIVFTDTGVGLVPEALKRLFEPFSSSHPEEGGTGLGLNISRWIVNKHKGDISIDSPGPGKGAIVTVFLPRAAALIPVE